MYFKYLKLPIIIPGQNSPPTRTSSSGPTTAQNWPKLKIGGRAWRSNFQPPSSDSSSFHMACTTFVLKFEEDCHPVQLCLFKPPQKISSQTHWLINDWEYRREDEFESAAHTVQELVVHNFTTLNCYFMEMQLGFRHRKGYIKWRLPLKYAKLYLVYDDSINHWTLFYTHKPIRNFLAIHRKEHIINNPDWARWSWCVDIAGAFVLLLKRGSGEHWRMKEAIVWPPHHHCYGLLPPSQLPISTVLHFIFPNQI